MLGVALAVAALAQPGPIFFTTTRTPDWGKSRLEQVSLAAPHARTLAVAPEEGAAFSPDGSLVASPVEGGRKLVVQPVDGGAERVVGTFPAIVGDLAWSPDGKLLAFDVASGRAPRELWLADVAAGGPARELRHVGRDPHWSPDGRTIAVASGARLVLVDPRTGAARTLVYADGSGEWSPDGRRLAYTADNDLHVVGRDGHGRRLVLSADQPRWSPDGKRIAFVRGKRLQVSDDRGGHLRTVAFARNLTLGTWTRSGRAVVFASAASDRSPPRLRVVDVRTRHGRTLASTPPSTALYDFLWTPTGALRYSVARSVSDPSEVWSMRPDGSDARPLTHDDVADEDPVASPDGTWVAYVRPAHLSSYDQLELWVVRPDGRDAHRVLRPAHYDAAITPSWSPDGRWIAITIVGAETRLYAVHPDGTGLHPLVPGDGNQDAVWSPDGTQLAYTCYGDKGSNVCVAAADGHGGTVVGPAYAEAPAWSPDGTQLAWERLGTIEIARRDGSDVRPVVRGGHPSWSPDGKRLAYTTDAGFDAAGFIHVSVNTIALDGSGDTTLTQPWELADQPFWSAAE